jgi:DNA-directed RNA polymerase specialized sigma24 family protein
MLASLGFIRHVAVGETTRSPFAAFPQTRLTVVDRLRDGEPAVQRVAAEDLVCAYWRPAYVYLRVRWRLTAEDAEDATQGFFTAALERRFFDSFDPAKARFRTFLRVCLDRFVQNERKAAQRLKRGGGVPALSLDFTDAEGDVHRLDPADPIDLEEFFRREYIRALFARAVTDTREACLRAGKPQQFAIFERYDLDSHDGGSRTSSGAGEERVSYATLARELGLTVHQVTNYLAAARRLFRTRVLEQLRDASGSEEDFRAEAREILGLTPGS